MTCEYKSDYTLTDYRTVKSLWNKCNRENSQQDAKIIFERELNRYFTPETASRILEAVLTGEFNPRFEIKQDVTTKPLVNDGAEELITSKPEEAVDFYVETQDRSVTGFFEKGANDEGYKTVVRDFNSRLIRDLIYDPKTGIGVSDPNAPFPGGTFGNFVNDRLFNYRLELLTKLQNLSGMPKIEIKYNSKPDEIRSAIARTLSAFSTIYRKNLILNDGKGIDKDFYNAYVTLYNFDKLLDSLGIIKIKDEYKNTNSISSDRYIYSGEKIKYNQNYGEENANIDDYTCPLVKLILNEIETLNDNGTDSGTKITLDGFKYTMNVISDWAWHQKPSDKIFKEISKGFLCDWDYLISEFINDKDNRNYVAKSVAKGIQKHIFSSEMPKSLTDLFRAQAHNTIQAYYLEYTNDYVNGHTVVKQTIPSERLIDRSAIILNKRLANKINFLQNNKDAKDLIMKDQYNKDKFIINVKEKSIKFYVPIQNGNEVETTITYNSDKGMFNYDLGFNGDAKELDGGLKSIVEQLSDIFIPDDYDKALLSIGADSLISVFAPVVWLTVFASDDFGARSQIFTYDSNPVKEDQFIKLSRTFGDSLRPAALFFNQLYGYNLSTVTKNLEGNNIPGYQLGSFFFRTFEIISDIKENPEHALIDNTFVRNPDAIVQTNTRESVSINGVTKNVTELCPAEVAQMTIIQDIWNKSRNVKKEDISKIVIDIQPMTYSDKKRQMTKAINISKIKLLSTKNGHAVTLGDIFNSFRDFAYKHNGQKDQTYTENEDFLVNEILDVRGRQTKRIALNYLNKFAKIFNLAELDYINANYTSIINLWNNINKKLAITKKVDVIKDLRKIGADFSDEIDLVETDDKKWVLNPVLLDDINLYLSTTIKDGKTERNRQPFDKYINLIKVYMIQDLIDEDFALSIYRDGSLRPDFDNWQSSRPDWVNSYSGNILMYKLRNAKSGEVLADQNLSNLEEIANGNVVVELNPILNTAFYLNLYLGQQLKVLHFGDTWGFKGTKMSSDYSAWEDKAKRFIAQTKRAVIGGGTVSLFILGLPFGVSDNARAACVDDLKSSVNDMSGDVHDDELVADGAIYTSPEQSIMENESLPGSSVGNNFKKPLYGWIDENGQLNEIKCASFTLSNNNRRQNPTSKTYNIEKMFYLMHKDTLPKFIDLTKYYSPNDIQVNPNVKIVKSSIERDRQITHDRFIYFYDNNTGKYYRINRLIQSQTGVSRVIQRVNEAGKEQGKEIIEQEVPIQTMYDIDKLFGGAWNMKLDPISKHLKFDNSNNKICANILCEEKIKNQIIHYAVTPSAMKVNVKNINPIGLLQNDVLNPDEHLWEFTINPKYSGVQMDAGHSVEGGHVTEMSQMIQHLIQDGYLVDYVEQIYDAIAEVTADGRKKYESVDAETIIKEISDALVKSLYINNGISTLADSFIKLAAENFEKYKLKIKNPFSDPSIKRKVATVIISNLSQQSLRRTYPGLGTVQAPSYGFMQYFNVKTKTGKILHMNYMKFCNVVRGLVKADETLEDLFKDKNSTEPGVITADYVERFKGRTYDFNNPNKDGDQIQIIESIDIKDIDFEDTLLIQRQDGNYDIIKINDVRSYDYWRNLQTDRSRVYRWNTQGRDLLPQMSRVNVNGITYNFFDFDNQRRSFYITEFIQKLKDPKYIIQAEQQKYDFVKRKYPSLNFKDVTSLQLALKQEIKNSRNTFLSYSESLKSKNIFETYQEAFNSQLTRKVLRELYSIDIKDPLEIEHILSLLQIYLISNNQDERLAAVQYIKENPEIQNWFEDSRNIWDISLNVNLEKPNVSRAQVIGGRIFGSKFGLSYEYVCDVLRQGPKFFEQQIRVSLRPPTTEGFKRLYDIQLHTGNNDNIYVLVGDTEENRKRWKNINSQSDKLKSIEGSIYYNGDYLCDSDGIEVGEFNDNGNKQIMVWVKDNNTLSEFKEALSPNFIRYNYTQLNAKYLILDRFHYNFNEDDTLKNDFAVNKHHFKWEIGTNINDIEFTQYDIEYLKQGEIKSHNRKVARISKDKYNSFLYSLQGIGARIPSQSMQSFSAVEFIDWVDTEENEIYLPKSLTWIAGSDYDIDKFFIMCWSIMNDGTLPVYKRIPGFSVNELATLPEPSNKNLTAWYVDTIEEALPNTVVITADDLRAWNNGNIEVLKRILDNDSKVTFVLTDKEMDDDTINEYCDDLVNTINEYNHTNKKQRKLIKSYSEHIFKNNVVRSLLNALNDPSVQINLLTALNMSAGTEIIKRNSSSKEKRMTSDNPISIIIQQYNNMVGRSGISGVAVSQKSFSTISFAIDSRLKKLADRVKTASLEDMPNVVEDIINSLSAISFIGKLNDPSLRSFGNINFRPLIQALKARNYTHAVFTNPDLDYSKFNGYSDNIGFRIIDFLQMLQDNSNKNNAYDLYSNLMSYATDNAKVLGLDKLNAVGNFIDYYCYLFATGESFNDIGDFMTSPLFNIVRRYSKQNIFEVGSDRIRSKHIIDFILDDDDLPIINKKLFQGSLSSIEFLSFLHSKYPNIWQEFANYIIDEFQITSGKGRIDSELLWSILKNDTSVVHTSTLVSENNSAEFNYKTSPKFINAVRKTLKNTNVRNAYLKWLEGVIDSKVDEKFIKQDEDVEVDDENYWDPTDYSTEIAEENNAKYSTWVFDINSITKDQVRSIYRYITDYLSIKNDLLEKTNIKEEDLNKSLQKLVTIANGAEEMSLLGRILAINQGMKGNDFDEFSFIAKMESGINRIYINKYKEKYSTEPLENWKAFEFVKFMTDKAYQEEQIKQFDKVKTTFNILDVLARSPHFSEMLQTSIRIRKSINLASVSLKLARDISKQLFRHIWANKDGKDVGDMVFPGLQYRLTDKEWKEISSAIDDLVIYHFVVKTAQQHPELFEFKVPEDFKTYNDKAKPDTNRDRFVMDSAVGLANFKRLMDKYIIPRLKTDDSLEYGQPDENGNRKKLKDNAFIRMLTLDSVSDSRTKQRKRYYKLSVNTDISENSPAYALYEQAREGLNEIAFERFEGKTIIDLFYLYNLLVSKENFGNTNFSMIFEDLQGRQVGSNLMDAFHKFVADLDAGDITLKPNEDGQLASQNVIAYDINDFLWRIVTPENAYKFNYAKWNDSNLIVPKKRYDNNNLSNPVSQDIEIKGLNIARSLSDFVINLPSLYKEFGRLLLPEWEGYKPDVVRQSSVKFKAPDVLYEVVRYLQELFGNEVPIKLIDNRDLENYQEAKTFMFRGNLSQEQIDKIKVANGFIDNGIIYINTDKYELSTPIHELGHLICAVLKFNPDKNVRKVYYDLLNAVWDKEKNKYPDTGKITPSTKEEELVSWLGNQFYNEFQEEWSKNVKTPIYSFEIKNLVRNALNTIFKTDISRDVRMNRLGNTQLEDFLRVFPSELFDLDYNSKIHFRLILNQQLTTLKNKYVEWDCIE